MSGIELRCNVFVIVGLSSALCVVTMRAGSGWLVPRMRELVVTAEVDWFWAACLKLSANKPSASATRSPAFVGISRWVIV